MRAAAANQPDERILLVGSSGGHLAQLMALRPWWGTTEHRSWCTFDTPDATAHLEGESDVTWAYTPTTRNIPNLIRNSWLALRLIRRFRPTVVVSTGAAVAFPFFVIGRITGATTVYIEVYDRVDSATLTASLCRPFTKVMCVQWEEQEQIYPGAHVIGPVL